MNKHNRIPAGFTLIELMIVVAIIGILSAIVIPNYTAYVTRGKITGATSALSDGRIRMEQFFQDNRTYVCGGGSPPCPTFDSTATSNFTYAFSGLTANTYTITATGKTSLAAYSYTINESNTKTSNTPWGNSATCWVIKDGGAC